MKTIILALSLLSFLSQAANYAEVGVEVESKRLNGNAYYIPGICLAQPLNMRVLFLMLVLL